MVPPGAGRPPKPAKDGRMQKQLNPWERGFTSVSLGEDAAEKLRAYMQAHGIKHKSKAVEHLLDHRQAPAPHLTHAPALPWDDLETILLEEFGLVHLKKIQTVIERLKAARQ